MCGNVEAVQMLLGAGATVDNLDKAHRTPLTQALHSGFRGSQVKANYSTIVTLLAEGGADLDLHTTEACNPLLTATLPKSKVMVNYFLELGADPNVRCKFSFDLFFVVCNRYINRLHHNVEIYRYGQQIRRGPR